MIKYSIIIPTCNKKLTRRCLEYISKLHRPNNEYEVLVIHNSSEDDIKSVVDTFQDKIENLRYIFEDGMGLLAGRHRGAKESKGKILCYLDDDSFVDKNYLLAIEKTFDNNNVLIAGGNNIPLYESRPPKWLKYFWEDCEYGRWLGKLSLIEFHNKTMKIPTWFVFGCNFIIRKDTLFEYDGFHPDGVPKNHLRFRGDGETALSCKLNKDGVVAYFNPKIKINHLVTENRMGLEYFKKRAFCQGVSDSFSDIRKTNGYDYLDFSPNLNVDKIKNISFKQFLNKSYKKYIFKIATKLDPNYDIYLNIKNEYEKSYQEGFDFHQSEVRNDSSLLEYVLKEDYLDI